MASMEQFLQAMASQQQQQQQVMTQFMEGVRALLGAQASAGETGHARAERGPDTNSRPPRDGWLNEKYFRRVDKFSGNDGDWKEWSLTFKSAVKTASSKVHDLIKWAETESSRRADSHQTLTVSWQNTRASLMRNSSNFHIAFMACKRASATISPNVPVRSGSTGAA